METDRGELMIDEDMSSAALRNVERPWKGIVITFTGVEQKVSRDIILESADGRTKCQLLLLN
jgi:hypothetical protein